MAEARSCQLVGAARAALVENQPLFTFPDRFP